MVAKLIAAISYAAHVIRIRKGHDLRHATAKKEPQNAATYAGGIRRGLLREYLAASAPYRGT